MSLEDLSKSIDEISRRFEEELRTEAEKLTIDDIFSVTIANPEILEDFAMAPEYIPALGGKEFKRGNQIYYDLRVSNHSYFVLFEETEVTIIYLLGEVSGSPKEIELRTFRDDPKINEMYGVLVDKILSYRD